ncbi:hypothetical protein V6N12_070339 [Hibiscus sabdariffa]|uniref:Alpha-amylase n=1 Tax=Hibiscus sabdariffa TaxID=183260 RepID=A0ABR2FGT4_9ROSI
MADIVINHRIGTTKGHGGMYNRYDGIPLALSEHAITSCTGGLGNRSTGDNFNGVPNIDHSQHFTITKIAIDKGSLIGLMPHDNFQLHLTSQPREFYRKL